MAVVSRHPARTVKASRSASMTVKATAHSEPRGSLFSTRTSFQPSAHGSRILLTDANDKQKVSTMSAEAI